MKAIIPVLNGHVWIEQFFFQSICVGFRWGAVRTIHRYEELRDVLESSERQHERLFAANAGGYIYGSGFISYIHLKEDGFGEYGFVGNGKPDIKIPGGLIYDQG